jgi:hypothetical protein
MNISKILRRVLLEDDEKKQARGNDKAGQYDLLNGVIQNCPTLNLKSRPIRFLEGNELDKFTDLKNTGVDPVYYVSQQYGDLMYVIFGVKDPNVKEPALFAYSLTPSGNEAEPKRVPNGSGRWCEQLKNIEDLGQVYLSPQAQAQFNNFIKKEGAGYASLTKPMAEDISLYEKVPYKDLQYRDKTPQGEPIPVFDPIPAEPGYAWVKTGVDYTSANLPDALKNMVDIQGFTFNQPTDLSADDNRYSFYLKDIMNDFPALMSQKNAIRPSQIIFPKADLMVPPNRETCRAAIKKLDYCLKSSSGVDCQKDLLKNKITVLRCGDLKMFGGVLGLKDEYQNVLRRGAPYGVADLARVLGKAQYGSVQKESLDKKINHILNEQFKKFRF